jgi:hypothetical protein
MGTRQSSASKGDGFDPTEIMNLQQRRRKEGLCPMCGGQPEPGFTRCEPCRIKENALVKYHKAHPTKKVCACGSTAMKYDGSNSFVCERCWKIEQKMDYK